jgi:hypothetical protein
MNNYALAVVRLTTRADAWASVVDDAQRGLVYEVQLASGHGARSQLDPVRFAGFFDPAIVGPAPWVEPTDKERRIRT